MQPKEQPLGPDKRSNLAKLVNGPERAGGKNYLAILGQMAQDPKVDPQKISKINELLGPVIALCDEYAGGKENKETVESERILSRLKILQGSFSGNEQELAVELKRVAKAYHLGISPDPNDFLIPSTAKRWIRQDPPSDALLFLNGELAVACTSSSLALFKKMHTGKWHTMR